MGYRAVNWIITALVALFLIFVVGNLIYSYASDSNNINRAKNNFEKLVAKLDVIMDTQLDIVVIYPPEGWFLRSDSEVKIRDDACFSESCICICETWECEDKNKRKCKGYDFDIEIDEDKFFEYQSALKLSSLEELRLIKGDDKTVIIRRIE